MKEINIRIKAENLDREDFPQYATDGSSGMDLRANFKGDREKIISEIKGKGYSIYTKNNDELYVVLKPDGRVVIPTGIKLEIPLGFEGQIRPRSGLALKQGITILNTPGTIDSDYRGDVSIILFNTSNEEFEIHHKDRIAQIIITEVVKVFWSVVKRIEDTERGTGGFGHTGK